MKRKRVAVIAVMLIALFVGASALAFLYQQRIVDFQAGIIALGTFHVYNSPSCLPQYEQLTPYVFSDFNPVTNQERTATFWINATDSDISLQYISWTLVDNNELTWVFTDQYAYTPTEIGYDWKVTMNKDGDAWHSVNATTPNYIELQNVPMQLTITLKIGSENRDVLANFSIVFHSFDAP